MLNQAVQTLASTLRDQYAQISFERKIELIDLSEIITQELNFHKTIKLNFICTHNSRRSQLAQIWMTVAALYFNIEGILCYSGGTEATAFNERMIKALEAAGFTPQKIDESDNPKYRFDLDNDDTLYFSKTYDDLINPKSGYIAVTVCQQANEACPIVFGAKEKFPLSYQDPKDFDNTPQEAEMYSKKLEEIGREMMFTLENTAAIITA